MASPVYTSAMEARAASLLETAQTWTWGRRKADGVQFVLFSSSRPGHAYYTRSDGQGCTCPSYAYRGACSHSLACRRNLEQIRVRYARPIKTYEEMFGLDEAF